MSVLIIDDDSKFIDQIVTSLEFSEIDADGACDEEEAWKALGNREYRLIILDLGMDEGIFSLARQLFCERLRLKHPEVPILGVTGMNLDAKQGFEIRKLGITDLFIKHEMNLTDFRHRIAGMLNDRNGQDVPAEKSPPIHTFVSYSHRDWDIVNSLVNRLQSHQIALWLDEHQFRAGDPIARKISSAIDDSDAMIVVISKDSLKSRWVEAETGAGLNEELSGKRKFSVLPVRIDDSELPALLRGKQAIDFHHDNATALRRLKASLLELRTDQSSTV